MAKLLDIEVEGLDKMASEFRKFNFKIPNIKNRFLTVIGEESLNLLKMNTPVDTGNLRDSWQLQSMTNNEIVIANDQQDLLSWITFGSRTHPMPNNFVRRIEIQVDRMVMERLQLALAENHRWFAKLPGGKQRKRQQVGRTSAGFTGGITFAGRSTLVRAGTGRRQLKRRLSLRRRRGSSVNASRKDVKLG